MSENINLSPRSRWAWVVWVFLVVAWTALLIVPIPDQVLPFAATRERKFYLAKTLHVICYMFLTLLAGWLQLRFHRRLLLLFFLMAHAACTEWLQFYLARLGYFNRTGSVRDVVLDHIGVLLGLALGWRWWASANER